MPPIPILVALRLAPAKSCGSLNWSEGREKGVGSVVVGFSVFGAPWLGENPKEMAGSRNWLTKHEPAIEPESVEAARQLAKAWEEFPVPQPLRRARSLPPREISSMSLDSSSNNSPPRVSIPMDSASLPSSNPPREDTPSSRMNAENPRRRLRGKTQPTPPSTAPSQDCPADSQDSLGSQSSEGRPEPYGCWDELYDVLRRPVLVDRHIRPGN